MTYEQFIKKYINLMHEAYRDDFENDLLKLLEFYRTLWEETQKISPKTEES